MLRIPLCLALFLLGPLSLGADDFQAGMEAYRQGDFPRALAIWRPFAEQGMVEAQFNVALLYHHGKGLEQDREEASRWYRLAADRGYPRAQYHLAEMYETGDGIKQDLIQAHFLFRLAGRERYEDARKRRRKVAGRMSAHDIAQAELLARQWKPAQD